METLKTLIAGLLCFIAASLSRAGGVCGGFLYLIAGLDLKTASTFSAFMVTGGSLSNVLYTLIVLTNNPKSSITNEIALLSETSIRLGVSAGVLGNVMFPELQFSLFCFFGFLLTRLLKLGSGTGAESEEVRRAGLIAVEDDDDEEPLLLNEEVEGIIQ